MEIALVSGNPHLPQLLGGVETNTHELAHELIQRGHRVSVFAGLSLRNSFGLRRAVRGLVSRQRISLDHDLGYPVYRARRIWEIVPELPRVSVALVQNGPMPDFAEAFARVGVPAAAYFLGLNFEEWDRARVRTLAAVPFRGYFALSRFTAERFRRVYGLTPTVVPPIFRRHRYETPVIGREVTFINPVTVKGVGLALEIAARCPDIPFRFVRGWPLGLKEWAKLKARLRRLPNVRLRDSTSDMRTVYRTTRILLVPSQWEAETWGRVASEAQFSGIPVVASNRGGLPEAVGDGGFVLGFDAPAEVWADTIRRLWTDEALYQEKSAAALRYSRRAELDPDVLVSMLLAALQQFAG
jgi:glycosyltransferase involved in cell wall biosynthesis